MTSSTLSAARQIADLSSTLLASAASPPADPPDWPALARLMTQAEKTRLNRAHRRLDTVAHSILTRLYAEPTGRRRPRTPRPTPEGRAAAEQLVSMVAEIPWVS
jgi:hypothetical protein